MTLKDIADILSCLGQEGTIYMARLPGRGEKLVGVYHSKHTRPWKTAIGGPGLKSYDILPVTVLIHWTESYRETEEAAKAWFSAIRDIRAAQTERGKVLFVVPLYDLQDVGTDDDGIWEMVIEAAFVCEKERTDNGVQDP